MAKEAEHDRPSAPCGSEIAAQAYDSFDAWCIEHDPEGDLPIHDRIYAYYLDMMPDGPR